MAYNYIITSDDLRAALDKIEEIKGSLSSDYEMITYDLEDEGVYSIVDELSTISLFSNPKLVVIKSAEAIVSASKKALQELFTAMNAVESENVCIFLFMDKLPKDNEVIDQLKRYASLIQIHLKDIPLDSFIQNEFSKDGYRIDSQALALFLSYQEDLSSIRNSIEQLKCYKLDTKEITDADIQLLVHPPLEDNVFQLTEAVIKRDKKRVFSYLKDFKLQSMQASYLVSMLINKFQELYNTAILVKSRISQNELAELFHVSSGRAYYMMKNAKELSTAVIQKNLDDLNELDYNIKIGKIDQNLGLELYFLK